MNDLKKQNQGYLLVALAGICWGLMGIITRKLNYLGFDSISIAAFRPTVAVIFYVMINLIKNPQCFKTDVKGLLFFMVYGVIALDGMFVAFTYAIEYTSIATASVLLFTNPIIVMIMSYFLFKEKFTKKKVLALILSIIGCFLIVKGYDSEAFKVNLVGIIWGIISGFTVALQNILGKIGVKKYSYRTHLMYSFLFASIFLWIFRPPWELIGSIHNGESWIYVIGIGVVATIIPNGAFLKALQYIESSVASIITSVEPVVASILGFLIFKETLEIPQLIGMVLVLFSVALIQLKNKENKHIENTKSLSH